MTGDREIYNRRALPLIEYVMSREKYLYATDEAITYQNPSHFLRGPCVEIGELAGLFAMTGGKSVGFKREAERLFGKPRRLNLLTDTGGGTWQDALAMYRITGEQSWLQKARSGADAHVKAEIDTLPARLHDELGARRQAGSLLYRLRAALVRSVRALRGHR